MTRRFVDRLSKPFCAPYSLDDEGLISVCDMMEYYESVEKLNISQNKNIGPRGWQVSSLLILLTTELSDELALLALNTFSFVFRLVPN